VTQRPTCELIGTRGEKGAAQCGVTADWHSGRMSADSDRTRGDSDDDVVVVAAMCDPDLYRRLGECAVEAVAAARMFAQLCNDARPVLDELVDSVTAAVGRGADWPLLDDPVLGRWEAAISLVACHTDALPIVGGRRADTDLAALERELGVPGRRGD
jgi:hypothetical protein